MNTKASEIFNAASEKVVSMDEWNKKSDVLYKQELTIGEKAFYYLVDITVSLFSAVADVFNQAVGRQEKDDGLYVSDTGSVYLSGAYLEAKLKSVPSYMPNKKFQDKVDGLAAQAFEQCEDHSQKPVMQRLRPL